MSRCNMLRHCLNRQKKKTNVYQAGSSLSTASKFIGLLTLASHTRRAWVWVCTLYAYFLVYEKANAKGLWLTIT